MKWLISLIPVFVLSDETWQDFIVIPEGNIIDVLQVDYMPEVECLAYNIYHESRGERRQGMELVAQVTMNRVESEMFHDTVCEVVKAPYQFSWTRDGISDAADSEPEKWEKSYLMAIDFLYNGKRLVIEGLDTEKILFYHAIYVSPGWYGTKKVFRYRNHVFYKLKE